MSFSKARIQRFNELPSDAPPPGAYDPKFDNRVKGITIEKTERFQDSKSVTSSGGECNSSVSSKGARALPSPKFRTPQLPKKRAVKPTIVSCPKAKTKLALGAGRELKYDVRHELADLKVECVNKDRTINEHANQIEEMKKEIWRLEKALEELGGKQSETLKLEEELEDLRAKKIETEERHKKDLESMAKLQQDILDSRDLKHLEELEFLRLQLSQIVSARDDEVASRGAFESRMELRHADVNESEDNLKGIELNAQSEINRLTKELAEITRAKEREIQKLSSIANAKENELSAVQTELQQWKSLSEELRNRVQHLESNRDTEIDFLRNEEKSLRGQINELSGCKSELEAKLHTRQQVILELQSQLSTVQCEVDELRADQERMSNECEAKISEILNNRDRELIDTNHNLMRERERLESEKLAEMSRRLELECENRELHETNGYIAEELKDVEELYLEASRNVLELQDELDAVKEKHAEDLERQKENMEAMETRHLSERSRLEKSLENARLQYIRELDNITEARNKDLEGVKSTTERIIEEEKRRIEERTDKIVKNAEAVTRETLAACRAESEERVKRIIAESDEERKKIRNIVRDTKTAVEKDVREAADRYVACLTKVEGEKLELEKKVNQKDAEISRLSHALEELKIVVENQESFSLSLQTDLDRVEAELAERKEELRTLKDQIRAESAEMVARRRRLDVVMAENQASVTALSQQLSESNAEIERLRGVVKNDEESINEHRDLLSAMRNTSKILTKEVYTLMDQLDSNKNIVDQIEAVNLAEIESVRSRIYAEIESFKLSSENEITRLREDVEKKDDENAVLRKHLEEMAGKVNEAHDMLLKMEELEDNRAIEMSKFELENGKLVRELKSTREANVALEAREAESKVAVREADQKIAELNAKIKALKTDNIQKEKVKMMQEQHESRLKEEILRRQALEDEVKKVKEDCENLRASYQEVSEKYTEMIGHHNHKQRVKHLNQLKEKILRLEKDAETKKHIIDQQTKTIEKLRAEEKRSFAKGKENIHSHGISRSPYATPVSSPLKPLTPLRDRNE